MKSLTKKIALLPIVAAGYLLAGCGQSAAFEAQYVKACIDAKQRDVTEQICKCMGRESAANMPPKFQQAMLLEMEGKKQQANALLEDISFEDRASMGMKQFEIVGKCMGLK